MSSANFEPKRTAAASRGFLATARLSCYTGETEHTADRAHTPNSSARAFNLLKFALKPEEEEEEALDPGTRNLIGYS